MVMMVAAVVVAVELNEERIKHKVARRESKRWRPSEEGAARGVDVVPEESKPTLS